MVERQEYVQMQKGACRRWEIVEETLEVNRQTVCGQGETHSVRTLQRWKGRHLLAVGGQAEEVEESLFTDRGPGLGVAVCWRPCLQSHGGEEEVARGAVLQVAAGLLVRAGVWEEETPHCERGPGTKKFFDPNVDAIMHQLGQSRRV